jgi:hypothetical protein
MIPAGILTRIAMAGAVLVLAFVAGWLVNGWRYQAMVSAIEADHATELEAATTAARAEEQRRFAATQRINDAATARTRARAAARGLADTAGGGLRIRADSIAAAASAASTSSECAAAADSARVLADVLGRLETAGRRAAATADERGDAGAACEAWAGAMTPG